MKDKKGKKEEKQVVYKKVKKKKVRIKILPVLLTLIIFYLIGYVIYSNLNKPISNIYISGNTLYSDWEIIEKAGLSNYPSSIKVSEANIEKKLEQDELIYKATIKKKNYTKVYIDIEENTPLFYDETKGKTILKDGTATSNKYDVPVLVNELSDDIYEDFLEEMAKVPNSVFIKISEIKYDPDEVDEERLLLTMNDGNYVYITMLKFDAIYDYNDIVETLGNKKGILYLNSGEYFKVMK